MTVYKYFIKIAIKNKAVILSYALIFFLLSIINGSSTAKKELSFVETKLNIGIMDNSNSQLSKSLKDYLGKKNNIIETFEDEEEIKEQIFLQQAHAVIVIPKDFYEKVINKEESILLYEDERKIESYQIKNQINKFLAFVNASNESGNINSETLETVKIALNEEASVEIIETGNKSNNKAAELWFKYYFNFTSYIIIAVYIAMLGLIMADFKDKKIEDRMKISSKKFLQLNKEMYLGQLTVASVITLIFILGAVALKGKHIGEVNFTKYVINIIVFSFSILCLTFLINNVTNSKFVKNGLSTVLSLGISFISGVMVPQELLGEKVLTIAKFFPTYYFIRINEPMVKTFSDMKYDILMQLLFAITFLLMGLYFSKHRET